MKINSKLVFVCAALSAAHPIHSQTLPEAGALQQQIERERLPKLPPVAPQTAAPPPAMQPAGVAIVVRQFRFAGNTLLSAEQLAPAVAGYLGRPLDFAQLQGAATAVANAYRDADRLVRAYLPQQDIQDGIVTIQIVEAAFGKLVAEGQPTRVTLASVLSRFEARQKPGAPLDSAALDRALLLADDLPGVTVSGALQAGARDGETDLVLGLADEPRLIGELSADNAGARSTGVERLAVNVALASPLGLGDQLSASAIHSTGSDYLRIAYSLPLGAHGWRLAANAARLGYHLVTPEFQALGARGDSTSAGLEASYPLIRSRLENLYLLLAYDRKHFDNEASQATTGDYAIDNLSLTLLGNRFDRFGGGGASSASLALSQGKVSLGAPNTSENASLQGGFSKLRYSLSRQQVITPDVSFLAAYAGQWANQNLDSAEKFYLGGANGVRAYPTNEGGGAKAQLVNLELRWKLSQGLSSTAFYDWGQVTQNLDNAAAGAAPNRYSLKGPGLSLSWQAAFGLNLKATWARRDGNNPNPSAAGKDQDGSLTKSRWWFNASMPF